jgi:hypothetical protein
MSRCTPSRETSGAVAAFAAGDLVDLVEEDDARVFHALDRDARDLVHIDQALLFFLDQIFEGLVDLHLPLLGALAEDVGQHVLDVDVHLLDALVGDDFEGGQIATFRGHRVRRCGRRACLRATAGEVSRACASPGLRPGWCWR